MSCVYSHTTGLCCPVSVTSFERQLTPFCADSIFNSMIGGEFVIGVISQQIFFFFFFFNASLIITNFFLNPLKIKIKKRRKVFSSPPPPPPSCQTWEGYIQTISTWALNKLGLSDFHRVQIILIVLTASSSSSLLSLLLAFLPSFLSSL